MRLKIYRSFYCFALILLGCLLMPAGASAYSVLTHQAIVDAAWEKSLQPVLLKYYPNATEEELRKAHAYAYGGSIIQDMGYFPFGNAFFTDLVHYVRTGDFVENLISSSQTLDELAFSLGALAHYNADIYGHPIGTNRAVPIVYPKVGAKYGDTVTYADDPVSHIKTEFGFDVLQVARGNYAPENYKNFIGFEVAPEVLERAFLQTYSLELKDVFVSLPLAIGSYRYTIRGLIPELTKAAWHAKKDEIQAENPGATRQEFVYRMRMARYHEQWGNCYDKPNIFTRFTSWIIRVLPKIGPLRPLALVPPTPQAEEFFMESFNKTVEAYNGKLKPLQTKQQPSLQNLQLDTGEEIALGDYELADETYAELLKRLSKKDFEHITGKLRSNVLGFYAKAPKQQEKQDEWEKTLEALSKLRGLQL
ncbi:zinc dependent phospholipase C family protein [Pontibacter cellulosilyticus]|uniref:Zinc dependent phospholipase C family protein n=1 Tax=Pontibacter cellulosilyticus TaxID=1720253 RepID=A0A923NBE6_9BACT|nr:zinc dependent phospholipase C family protein [Pontibacter cellulosilyticus]MBC5994816.1 zinc dependent phospholipase C family protein [Pontibacter cellulosilyticus]